MSGAIAAVILAGGDGRRLGGADKPELLVGGRTLLEVALSAVGDGGDPTVGEDVVIVGPPRGLQPGIRQVREQPVGGGPAAAVAAGVIALPNVAADTMVTLLAADLPGIERSTVARLRRALTDRTLTEEQLSRQTVSPLAAQVGGAVLLDAAGRRQYLIGVWRLGALTAAIARRQHWTGRPLRELLAPIPVVEVQGSERETADVDTPADWRRWQS